MNATRAGCFISRWWVLTLATVPEVLGRATHTDGCQWEIWDMGKVGRARDRAKSMCEFVHTWLSYASWEIRSRVDCFK